MKERCDEKVLSPRLPSCQPTRRVHFWGFPGRGTLAEALYSTTWEHVLIFKHVSNSSCNHMLKVKPHA